MTDRFGRKIDYLRISITDRCNLRCIYCMPEGVDLVEHRDLLRYEELLSVARAAVSLGITHFKVTGGEPLVRRGCLAFLKELKALPGVETVSLTTNGVLLAPLAEDLAEVGIDGVNVSLDTTDPVECAHITGSDCLPEVLAGIGACLEAGIPTKLNCVLLEDCRDRLADLPGLTEDALEERRADLNEAIEKVRQREAAIRARTVRTYRRSVRILRSNPTARARQELSEALESLRKLGERK